MTHAAARSSRTPWLFAATALATVAGLIALAFFMAPPRPTPGGGGDDPHASTARVVEARDVTRRTLDDGTVLVAHAGTKYALAGPRRIVLQKGDLYLIVAKGKEAFGVTTPHGVAQAMGTRFTISAGGATTVAVGQGRVRISSAGEEIDLLAGQQGLLPDGKPPRRGPAPRFSHLVSWAKEALAQEELLVEKAEVREGLVALDPWGQESHLTLRKYIVDVYIEDGIARTTIDQTFFNHYPWNTEGTFYFPLPPDASVSRLAMYVFGQVERGRHGRAGPTASRSTTTILYQNGATRRFWR